jgi:alpha-1,6-mannosyltransferase
MHADACHRHYICRLKLFGKNTYPFVFGLLALNAAFSVLSLQASMANYPGGEALSFFNAHYANVSHGLSLHHIHASPK